MFFGLSSSSSESLLLDEAGFLTGFATTTGVAFAGAFFCLSSSDDESESDEESFFFLFVRFVGGGIATFGVTFDGTGAFLTGSSSSESLLLDEAGFFDHWLSRFSSYWCFYW